MTSENTLDTTIDDWRAAIEEKDSPGITIAELAKELGISVRSTRYRVAQMIHEGRCIVSGKARRATVDGRIFWIPVYQLVKNSEDHNDSIAKL